jgi:hypothetical protein
MKTSCPDRNQNPTLASLPTRKAAELSLVAHIWELANV